MPPPPPPPSPLSLRAPADEAPRQTSLQTFLASPVHSTSHCRSPCSAPPRPGAPQTQRMTSASNETKSAAYAKSPSDSPVAKYTNRFSLFSSLGLCPDACVCASPCLPSPRRARFEQPAGGSLLAGSSPAMGVVSPFVPGRYYYLHHIRSGAHSAVPREFSRIRRTRNLPDANTASPNFVASASARLDVCVKSGSASERARKEKEARLAAGEHANERAPSARTSAHAR